MQPLPWHEPQFEQLLARLDRLPHALLLSGGHGTGKVAFACALAAALLCESRTTTGRACGKCPPCGWVATGNHPDLFQLTLDRGPGAADTETTTEKKAATQITIEQVRELPDFINITSHRGGAKVVLLHPAEALNISAANALLKNLEEPPANTYFLMVSHRPTFLLATIRSRCQAFPLRPPDLAAATRWLAGQGMKNAELALAQTGNAPLLALDLVDADFWKQRAALLDTISAPDFEPFQAAERVRDLPVPSIVGWLQKWTYDIVSGRVVGRVRYNPDYQEKLSAISKRAHPLNAGRFHRKLVRLQRIVNHPLNPRLMIEDLLLCYADAIAGPSGDRR